MGSKFEWPDLSEVSVAPNIKESGHFRCKEVQELTYKED
jgi:hypothetical protein